MPPRSRSPKMPKDSFCFWDRPAKPYEASRRLRRTPRSDYKRVAQVLPREEDIEMPTACRRYAAASNGNAPTQHLRRHQWWHDDGFALTYQTCTITFSSLPARSIASRSTVIGHLDGSAGLAAACADGSCAPRGPSRRTFGFHGAALGAASDFKNSSTCSRSFSDRRLYACAAASPSPS